jgi:hypothetical protein
MNEIKESLTSELFATKILPSLLGLLAGVIGGLFTPWIKWQITKKKELLATRRRKVDSWRSYVEEYFDWDSFRDTSVFSEMKPFLSEKIVQELYPSSFCTEETPTNYLRSPIGRDDLKMRLLNEITRIEKNRWKLI